MASIFKQKYTVAGNNGKRIRKQSKFWYIDYKAADGTRKRVKGYKDKAATAQLAARLEREVELEQAGLVDKYKEHRKRPLIKHAEEFRASLSNKGTTAKQAQQVYNRTTAILKACKFVFMADIQASKIQRYLAGSRQAGLSIRSSNFYLQAIKQFCRWMVADGRTADNPIEYLKGQTVVEQRERRALSPDEIDRLLETTAKGPKHHSMTAKARHMLYVLGLTSGLRASELASLTWLSMDLDTTEPTVTIKAGYTKNRKETTLPLRQDIAGLFKQWQTESGANLTDRIFAGFNPKKGAAMLRRDLEAACIDYQDEGGRFADFHALRHSFITNVVKSGATVKESQTLARHSKPELTLGVYTHIGISDERRALEKMPTVAGTDRQSNKAVALRTGTDDKPLRPDGSAYKPAYKKLAKNAFSGFDKSAAVGTSKHESRKKANDCKPLHGGTLSTESTSLSRIDTPEKTKAAAGFEPANNGFANRRLRPLGYAAVLVFGQTERSPLSRGHASQGQGSLLLIASIIAMTPGLARPK